MGRSDQSGLRIGLDVGGSKIEGILMGPGATELARYRVATPRKDYPATVVAIVDLLARLMQNSPADAKIGIAIPGSISPVTGLMQNANSTWLNGRRFDRDLEVALATPVRLANDANCFALSEAIDGAAENAHIVFGVILGTGCGGGLVVNGSLLDGLRGISGECNVGLRPRHGCGSHQANGETRPAVEIANRAKSGNGAAIATMSRHADRLARGLAHVVNIIDPDVIVLGGGLSGLSHLYERLPRLIGPHIGRDQGS
jgi:fructokinase